MTYVLGTTNAGAVKALQYINDGLRINALGEATTDAKAFGSFSKVEIETYEFHVTFAGEALKAMTLHIDGAFLASYPGSRGFQTAQDAVKPTTKAPITNRRPK